MVLRAAKKEAHRLSSLQHYHRYSLCLLALVLLMYMYYSNKDSINAQRRIPPKESEPEIGQSESVSKSAEASITTSLVALL